MNSPLWQKFQEGILRGATSPTGFHVQLSCERCGKMVACPPGRLVVVDGTPMCDMCAAVANEKKDLYENAKRIYGEVVIDVLCEKENPADYGEEQETPPEYGEAKRVESETAVQSHVDVEVPAQVSGARECADCTGPQGLDQGGGALSETH